VNQWHLRLAVRVLRRGGLVVHATEGVWGIAADPWNSAAIADLLLLKGRAHAKGLIVIGAEAEMFADEISSLDPAAQDRIAQSWPGPVTWIVPTDRYPAWVTGRHDTVGIRVPGHPQARALSRVFGGPLVSTSANLSGRPPARRVLQATQFVHALAGQRFRSRRRIYLLPGETMGNAGPSEIRTLSGEYLRLRQGDGDGADVQRPGRTGRRQAEDK
jgi:L-threonylcarbamoyladenylate synthase